MLRTLLAVIMCMAVAPAQALVPIYVEASGTGARALPDGRIVRPLGVVRVMYGGEGGSLNLPGGLTCCVLGDGSWIAHIGTVSRETIAGDPAVVLGVPRTGSMPPIAGGLKRYSRQFAIRWPVVGAYAGETTFSTTWVDSRGLTQTVTTTQGPRENMRAFNLRHDEAVAERLRTNPLPKNSRLWLRGLPPRTIELLRAA